jgi:phenylacetate-coenzyme A ligase PaaK-like adenylate-forming protein
VIGPGVAAECAEAADGLHVNEDHFLVEAVDPVTAKPVADGTQGELVFSTLTREAGPLLRYRTGDIAALRRDPCPCGRTLVKMSQVTGRRDDMLVIRGVNVYPSEVERVLLGHTSLSPDYLLVVDERAAQSQLLALCEYAPGSSRTAGARQDGAGPDGAQEPGPAEADLELRLREVLGVRVGVRVLAGGTLPRTEVGKAVRVVRWAGGEPPVPGLS